MAVKNISERIGSSTLLTTVILRLCLSEPASWIHLTANGGFVEVGLDLTSVTYPGVTGMVPAFQFCSFK